VRARRAGALLAALALALAAFLGALGPAGLGPSPAAAAGLRHLKVAIIVGPVGSLTDYYRRLANEGAAVARRHADQVVTVYSPNATWPAVRAAMNGASIVVYLGHGNGWPSIYSGTLRAKVMNGLGLNPVAGVDDEAHQYFGEAYLKRYVRLAPGAAVILSHLCYASGAAEPGMANPSLDVAVKRVDNFGAGFLAAGAAAVVAETHGGPAPYLASIFRGQGTIESIWRAHPLFHGHVQAFTSARTNGARLFIDPDRASYGYYRSLVVRPGVRTADILAGAPAGWSAPVRAGGGPAPALSLVARGASPARVALAGAAVAGARSTLRLTFNARTAALLPDAFTIGTRWNLLEPAAAIPAAPAASAAPASVASPGPGATPDSAASPATPALPTMPGAAVSPTVPGASASPGASPPAVPGASPPVTGTETLATPGTPGAGGDAGPAAAATPDTASPDPAAAVAVPSPSVDEPVMAPAPPDVDLVKEEVIGSLVTISPTAASTRKPAVKVAMPAQPGLYRLVVTLHDATGIAYDAATQDLFPALVVQVTGPLWATYGTPDGASVGSGRQLDVRVTVANSGAETWGTRPVESLVDPAPILAADPPLLVARWIGLDGSDASGTGTAGGTVPAYVDPGTSTTLEMVLTAPVAAGSYLLLFDVLLPDGRSLASAGVPPGLLRVTVEASAAQAAPASGVAVPASGAPAASPGASQAPPPLPSPPPAQ
jgi:hypothetical protein